MNSMGAFLTKAGHQTHTMKTNTLLSLGGACALALVGSIGLLAQAETVVTQSAGTISEFSPDALVIRSETATAPTRYVVSREVQYVDDAGAPVSVEVVKSGLPVTVHYVREGDRVIAQRIVVHRHVTTAPVVEERHRVIEERPAAPVIEERRPVIEERHRVIEQRPAVVEEKRTVIEQRPVVEEHRTTTTTTTTSEK